MTCLVCAKEATGGVFECSWCEVIQHTSCSSFSTEQCNTITNIASVNIVFLCTSCLRALSIAVKQYNNQLHIVNHTESQINNHQKTNLTTINRIHEKTSRKILDFTAKLIMSSVSSLNSQLY